MNAIEQYSRPRQPLHVRGFKRMRPALNRWLARQSLVGDTVTIDPARIEGLDRLAREWRTIRGELLALLAQPARIPAFGEISPDHRRIARDARWQSFFFEGYGYRSRDNCAACPQTARLLSEVPDLVVAFFSIMRAGTHVPRHRGLSKAWLNCHLPLLVPKGEGKCEMEIGGQVLRWREGEWQVFDETYPHEVWNETEEDRVVLFLQVRRPMRPAGRLFARALHSAIRHSSFVQDVRKTQDFAAKR